MNKPALASRFLGIARLLVLSGCIFGALGYTQPVLAARLVDVSIINRSTGERLTPWRHAGKLYVAGTPGDSYAIEVTSRQGGRLLTVLSVDGVNVLTGETAATLQSGYVIDNRQNYSITGWRKSMDDIAQFVFTALPGSYAARTGRPGNVGVIGVAVYREKPTPSQPLAIAQQAAPAGAPTDRRERSGEAMAEAKSTARKLGTGHGEREHSPTRYTDFVRNSDTPDEVISIYYDSHANLTARGIIPSPRVTEPSPFPGGNGFVPDPLG